MAGRGKAARRFAHCLIVLIILGGRSTRAENLGWLPLLYYGPLIALVPAPHVEFGPHPAFALAWPLRPLTLAWALGGRTGDSRFWLGLTPDIEPQYSFAGACRLSTIAQVSLGYHDTNNRGVSLIVEGGRVFASDGNAWMGGAGLSFGSSDLSNGLVMSWGVIARENWLDTEHRFDIGLDFHVGIVTVFGRE